MKALNQNIAESMTQVPIASDEPDTASASPELLKLLASVIDPETGINIVDMGLVYESNIQDGVATVLMTMTSAACPVGELLLEDVNRCLRENLPASTHISVSLTFDPPWEPAMMSESARNEFGW